MNVKQSLSASLFLVAVSPLANAQVTGTALWLKADAGITVDVSNRVTNWADQSGNGHNASNLVANNSNPDFVTGGLNGLPVLRFDGTENLIVSGQVLTSQQYTIMAVVTDNRSSDDTSFREIISNWDGASTTTSVFLGTANSDPVRARFTDDMGGATDPNNTQAGVGEITDPQSAFVLSGVSDLNDASIYQGRDRIAVKGSPISTRNLTTGWAIGTQGSGNFEGWQGDIAEILVYDRALTQEELTTNWDYLHTKYNVAPVPAPSSVLTLLLGGIPGACFLLRRRKR